MVTWNSRRDLAVSLASAASQQGVSVEVLVVDNASTDESVEIARTAVPDMRLVQLDRNAGYAAAMNAGVDSSSGRYVLALNPDCRLEPDFASTLVARLDVMPDVGSASGRLYRAAGPGLTSTGMLDSAGIRFTSSGRHLDRGADEPGEGRYLDEELISGPSGAAGFYRREALADVRISTGYFDTDFFAYREDADLALRLMNVGWKSVYVPSAIGYHRRANRPERRRAMSREINYHSVKNRYLLRINNQSGGDFIRTLVPTTLRDLVVLAACVTVERTSLPAYQWLWRNRHRLIAKRREIAALRSRSSQAASSGSGEARHSRACR
jgi:GT2 family glycosyltransferase